MAEYRADKFQTLLNNRLWEYFFRPDLFYLAGLALDRTYLFCGIKMFKLASIFFIKVFLFAFGAQATKAYEHEAFLANCTREHLELLTQQENGTFLIYENGAASKTYSLVVVKESQLFSISFRHDDGEILVKTSQAGTFRLFTNNVDCIDNFIGPKNNRKIFSLSHHEFQFLNPIGPNYISDYQNILRQVKSAEKKLFKEQPWRKKAAQKLRDFINSGEYKCEINEEFDKIITSLFSSNYSRKNYKNDLKNALNYQKELGLYSLIRW